VAAFDDFVIVERFRSILAGEFRACTGFVGFFWLDNSPVTIGVLATATLNNGVAAFSPAALPPGSNVLTASYGGDARNGTSTSADFTQVISSNHLCNILPPRQLPVKLPPLVVSAVQG
jgi:hypothetical protein